MAARPLSRQDWDYWPILIFLILITVADGVLIAILMFRYTQTYVLFVNQGTAFVYGCISVPLVLGISMRKKGGLDQVEALSADSRPVVPKHVLVICGIMNGLGNFCSAIGQPHTRGDLQSLFKLFGIPVVLVLSWICLRKRPSLLACLAAGLIVGGIAVSSSQSFGEDSGGVTTLWYSATIMLCGQFFWSGETIYEEAAFKNYRRLDVFIMFMWVIWTQFLLGWLLYPIQSIKVFGDIDIADIPQVILDGLRCTVGLSSPGTGRPSCSWLNPFLFFTYCIVDYTCYAWGLYVIQRGGANLNALAAAVAVPLQQLAFTWPIDVKGFGEQLHATDFVALCMVLLGFGIYSYCAREGTEPVATVDEARQDMLRSSNASGQREQVAC